MRLHTTSGCWALLVTLMAGLLPAGPALGATTMKLGSIAPKEHPMERGLQHFAKLVEDRSQGALKVQVFAGGVLGGEIEVRDQVSLGAIQMVNTGTKIIGASVPEMEITALLYTWRDADHMKKVWNSPLAGSLYERLEKRANILPLAVNWLMAPRHVLLKKPVRSAADFQGVKLRSPAGIPLTGKSFAALGATPSPLPFPEVYSAMQQGVIDGFENPMDWFFYGGYYEIAKYVILTEHNIEPFGIWINSKFYHGLSPQHQEVLKQAALDAGDWEWRETLKVLGDLRQKMEAAGITFIVPDREEFRRIVWEKVNKPYLREKGWEDLFAKLMAIR